MVLVVELILPAAPLTFPPPRIKKERNWLILQFQQVALHQRMRISFLSGDVHCAAVGLLYTHGKGSTPALQPEVDWRYMLNVSHA